MERSTKAETRPAGQRKKVSPIVGFHVTHKKCRDSIRQHGLLASRPSVEQPPGVYVFRLDGALDHVGWNSRSEWTVSHKQDLWAVSYIGPIMFDQYVLNGLVLLGNCPHVTLLTGN